MAITPTGSVRHVYSGQSITSAINASSAGDSVVVHAGSYPLLSLSGKSAGGEIKVIAAAGETVNVAGADIRSSSNVSLSSFNWTGNVYLLGTTNVRFQGGTSRVSLAANNFDVRDNSQDTYVEDMRISGGDSHFGIQAGNDASRSRRTFIRNNDMGDASQDHVIINRGIDVYVQQNLIHGVIDTAEHSDGVQSVGGDGVYIDRNEMWTPRAARDAARDRNDDAVMLNSEPSTGRQTRNVRIEQPDP